MSNKQDGGPAFPTGLDLLWHAEGMSLRDYFAAKAMQGMLTRPGSIDPQVDAAYAYTLADAMLRARDGL